MDQPIFIMGETVRFGTCLFIWKSDGKLHSRPDGTLTRMAPLGFAAGDLDRHQTVRVLPGGVIRRLIFNPCGKIHLGRCCVNGTRLDGSIGPTCTHCGDAMSHEQREQLAVSYALVAQIRKQAGATS